MSTNFELYLINYKLTYTDIVIFESDQIQTKIIDPIGSWAGSHHGFSFEVNLQLESSDIKYNQNNTILLLRLCSPTTKTYISSHEIKTFIGSTDCSLRLDISAGSLSFGSEWYIELLVSHNHSSNFLESPYMIDDKILILTKLGESNGSRLPIILDSTIDGLWELRWKTPEFILPDALILDYPAEEAYEIAVNNKYQESNVLYNDPFKDDKKWAPLALEVYSHVITELILNVHRITNIDDEDYQKRDGSLFSFVCKICHIAQINSSQINSESHWGLFLIIRRFLSRK
jgi:hypothetical protein